MILTFIDTERRPQLRGNSRSSDRNRAVPGGDFFDVVDVHRLSFFRPHLSPPCSKRESNSQQNKKAKRYFIIPQNVCCSVFFLLFWKTDNGRLTNSFGLMTRTSPRTLHDEYGYLVSRWCSDVEHDPTNV